jgi:CheY-like chemotaxis protein
VSSSPPRRSLVVLVADDDEVVIDLLDRLFSRRGHQVHGARSAEEAAVLSGRLRFDAAIVDVNMPGGGRAVAEGLVRDGSLDGPLLVITGDPGGSELPEGLPVTEVVGKPFRFAELVARVERSTGVQGEPGADGAGGAAEGEGGR